MRPTLLLSLMALPFLSGMSPAIPPSGDVPRQFQLISATAPSQRNELRNFDLEGFITNLRERRNFVVLVTLKGHPISIRQEPALAVLLEDRAFRDLRIYLLDLSTQAEDAEKIQAEEPGMLMVYRDGREISRTVRVIDPDDLADLLAAAL